MAGDAGLVARVGRNVFRLPRYWKYLAQYENVQYVVIGIGYDRADTRRMRLRINPKGGTRPVPPRPALLY